jgi:beta-lactamase class A
MTMSRRSFLATPLIAAGVPAVPWLAEAALLPPPDLGEDIIREFSRLPGRKALKISAPGVDSAPPWSAELNAGQVLFCASSFKVFVLTEFLRRAEAQVKPNTPLTKLLARLLTVNDSVWMFGSPVLAPKPEKGGMVTGRITALTALEAMIAHSDNTATDMALKRLGPDSVRALIAGAGLQDTRIPNATRQFFAYEAGAPNWRTITWPEMLDAFSNLPRTGPPIINGVQTMASTPNDFVSFYARALQGEFFEEEGTLTPFRSILAQADAIPLIMPLGVNAFLKGGSLDLFDEHALSIAGGMFIPARRWVYYSLMINWVDGQGGTTETVGPLFAEVLGNIFTWIRDAFAG